MSGEFHVCLLTTSGASYLPKMKCFSNDVSRSESTSKRYFMNIFCLNQMGLNPKDTSPFVFADMFVNILQKSHALKLQPRLSLHLLIDIMLRIRENKSWV